MSCFCIFIIRKNCTNMLSPNRNKTFYFLMIIKIIEEFFSIPFKLLLMLTDCLFVSPSADCSHTHTHTHTHIPLSNNKHGLLTRTCSHFLCLVILLILNLIWHFKRIRFRVYFCLSYVIVLLYHLNFWISLTWGRKTKIAGWCRIDWEQLKLTYPV
jgi:hypothetical protein